LVGGWFALATYALWPEKRRWAQQNFAHVLGTTPSDPRARRLARDAYRHYARYGVELMRLPWATAEETAGLLEVEGEEAVERIWKSSNGLLIVAGHLGNNEAAAAGFASRGLPISVVADDSSYGELFDLLRRQRAAWGVDLIPWRNLRAVYGVLRRREILGLLVDWGYRGDGIPVKFFGSWTTLPAGPAVLAARNRSTILPVIVRRLPDGRFRATMGDTIVVPSATPADLQRATQAVADALERGIAEAPEQWYIFKPIWPPTVEEEAALAERAAAMLRNDPRAGSNGGTGNDGNGGTANDGNGAAVDALAPGIPPSTRSTEQASS
jgi:KDO2-lipid IV(A) lauroyltransferase